ncbi:MAG: hypothetical protein K9I26_03715 [Flavobacterium sp.]|nr:hypothetical protein [Flavobacterium sp.]
MELKEQAQWLKGFLDAMKTSDSISKRQIETLFTKLEKLITSIEEFELDDYYEAPVVRNKVIVNSNSSNSKLNGDDLPF